MPAEIHYYHNFSVDSPTLSLTVILWALCAGLAIGACALTFTRHRASKLIGRLVESGASDAENAKYVRELSLKPTRRMRKMLRDDETLRKYIIIANPDEARITPEKPSFFAKVYRHFRGELPPASYDLQKAKLYIPESARITAQVRYESKGNPFISSVIVCIVFLLIATGLSYCMPLLLDLLDSAITGYKEL